MLEVEDAFLSPKLAEFDVEVSQSRAASMGLRAPVEVDTLEADDDEFVEVVLVFDGSWVAKN